jgi:hypothetical protein
MKSTALLLYLLPIIAFGQWYEEFPYKTVINFDTEENLEYIYRDTISNPSCIWQVAAPNKSVFTAPYSSPNVMLTDSVNSYPVNDTSSFIFYHEMVCGLENGSLSGRFYVDSDSSKDFGKIEASIDLGTTWVLVSEDTLEYIVGSGDTKTWPDYIHVDYDLVEGNFLTGESDGWKYFYIDLSFIEYYLGGEPDDTLLIKFSFLTDSILTIEMG